jgi:hypothetical protein
MHRSEQEPSYMRGAPRAESASDGESGGSVRAVQGRRSLPAVRDGGRLRSQRSWGVEERREWHLIFF